MSHEGQRFCKRCGKPLPEGVHFNVRYCPACRKIMTLEQGRASKERAKQRQALQARQAQEAPPPKPSGWDPKSGETYAEYQRRTFIHPSTTKPLGEAVKIAPRKGRRDDKGKTKKLSDNKGRA